MTEKAHQEDNTLPVAALVCGILSLSTCGPFPLGFIAMGLGYYHNNTLKSAGKPKNGLATAGFLTGTISVIMGLLSLAVAAVFILLYFFCIVFAVGMGAIS